MKTNRFLSLAAIFAVALTFFACSGNFEPIPYESRNKLNSDASSSSVVLSSSSTEQQGSSSSSVPSSNSVVSSSSAVTSQCGGEELLDFQFCYKNSIYDKCNGNSYNPESDICCSNELLSINIYGCCNSKKYTLETQFCNTNIIYDKCGGGEYDLKTYFCDARDKALYKYVTIGDQIWMAKNLNYAASGSKCGSVLTGSGTLVDANTFTCDTYGRLYGSGVDLNNICPSGWHLPSNAEWNTLMRFVNSDCNDNTNCAGVGTKLKATDGWNDFNGSSRNGTDDFGFSALPGGYGISVNFNSVGYYGYWLSSDIKYARGIESTDVLYYNDNKSLTSVRCIKN